MSEGWAISYGPLGTYMTFSFDHGNAMRLATDLHGTLERWIPEREHMSTEAVAIETITLDEFWMDREDAAVTDEMRANAKVTVDRVNLLLERAAASGVAPTQSTTGFGCCDSGYRPEAINAATPGAAKNSNHKICKAVDVSDDDGDLDDWLMSQEGQKAMEEIGLWHEHPSSTKGWAHLQTVAPRSGRRTYYP